MNLEKLSSQLSSQLTGEAGQIPPVQDWNPPYCGEMDLTIKKDGNWFYNGTIFKRDRLVKLLASVLKKEGEEHFLVTPVEKIKIVVEDAPFIITQWRWSESKNSTMVLTTNVNDEFELNAEHPMLLGADDSLYIEVRYGLLAKVHRNVYYQWVGMATEQKKGAQTEIYILSAGQPFVLGSYE